jgi:hypothetical protein
MAAKEGQSNRKSHILENFSFVLTLRARAIPFFVQIVKFDSYIDLCSSISLSFSFSFYTSLTRAQRD